MKSLYRKLMRDQFSKSDKGTQTAWDTPMVEFESFKESLMVDKGVQTFPFANLSPIHSPRVRSLQTFDEEDDLTQDNNDENATNYKAKELTQPTLQASIFHDRRPRNKTAINYKGEVYLLYSALPLALTCSFPLAHSEPSKKTKVRKSTKYFQPIIEKQQVSVEPEPVEDE